MNKYLPYIIITVFLLVVAVFVIIALRTQSEELQQAQIALQTSKIALKIARLEQSERFGFWGWWIGLGVVGSTFFFGGLIIISCYGVRLIREKSVFYAKIGEHSEIPIKYKYVQEWQIIGSLLAEAEITSRVSVVEEKKLAILGQIADKMGHYINYAIPQRALPEPEQAEDIIEAQVMEKALTLRECEAKPDFDPSKILIGYSPHSGELIQRTIDEMGSCMILGKPQKGKSYLKKVHIFSALRFYEQGANVQGWIIDPHFGNNKSLGTFFKGCLHHPFFERKVLYLKDFQKGQHVWLLEQALKIIETRQQSGHEDPKILIYIDELRKLCQDEKWGKKTQRLVKELLNSIKFGVFVIASSQDLTAKGMGDTALNDMACTHFVFQSSANKSRGLLHTDAQLSEKLPVGQCYLIEDDEPILVQIPQILPTDIDSYTAGNTCYNNRSWSWELARELVNKYKEDEGISQNEVARRLGINQGKLSVYLNNSEGSGLTQPQIIALQSLLGWEQPSNNKKVVQLFK